jgi:hypothetical protein
MKKLRTPTPILWLIGMTQAPVPVVEKRQIRLRKTGYKPSVRYWYLVSCSCCQQPLLQVGEGEPSVGAPGAH